MTWLDDLRRSAAVAVGRSPDREGLAARCPQCGRDDTTVVHYLDRRHAEFWCVHCGAVVSTRDLASLRPAPAPAPPDPHAGVLAPAVLSWARSAAGRVPAELDRAAYLQLHSRFDRAGVLPGLPAVSAVIGKLHDHGYRIDPVLAELGCSTPAARERAVYARRWLAGPGRGHCWIVSRETADRPAVSGVESAAEAFLGGGEVSREQLGDLRAALFGTDGGPGARRLLGLFTAAEIEAAVTAYGEGLRPLRDAVLRELES